VAKLERDVPTPGRHTEGNSRKEKKNSWGIYLKKKKKKKKKKTKKKKQKKKKKKKKYLGIGKGKRAPRLNE